MTEKEINVAITIACGGPFYGLKKRGYWYRPDAHGYTDRQADAWHLSFDEAQKHEYNKGEADERVLVVKLDPDFYCTDLNAMHEAERSYKTGDPLVYYEWLDKLTRKDGTRPWCATASQRAEAFLRTIGKWIE